MREILFRGKRIDNAEWVYGSLVSLDDKGKAILKSKSAVYMPNGKNTISSTDCYEVDPETVGQYTGFKDKNGNKFDDGLSGYKMKAPKQFEFSDNDYLQNIKLLNDMIYGEVDENQ